MDQEKFGKFIKKIRKQNNLTQKDLAEKYNVTYQAVSKWENGKNMPDMSLIHKMSKDFNISIEDMIDGKIYKKNNKKTNIILIILIILLIITLVILYKNKSNTNFEFKTLTTTCDNFNISGSISYNDKKSSIYITNIKYCGEKDTDTYKEIECTLYESNNNIQKIISSYNYDEEDLITLEEFLNKVTLTVDNYKQTCTNYTENSLYLIINATNKNNKTTTFKIPLKLEETCK